MNSVLKAFRKQRGFTIFAERRCVIFQVEPLDVVGRRRMEATRYRVMRSNEYLLAITNVRLCFLDRCVVVCPVPTRRTKLLPRVNVNCWWFLEDHEVDCGATTDPPTPGGDEELDRTIEGELEIMMYRAQGNDRPTLVCTTVSWLSTRGQNKRNQLIEHQSSFNERTDNTARDYHAPVRTGRA